MDEAGPAFHGNDGEVEDLDYGEAGDGAAYGEDEEEPYDGQPQA